MRSGARRRPLTRLPVSMEQLSALRRKAVQGRLLWSLSMVFLPGWFLLFQGSAFLDGFGALDPDVAIRWPLARAMGLGVRGMRYPEVEKYFRKLTPDDDEEFATCRIAPACVNLHTHEAELILPADVAEADGGLLNGCAGSEIAVYRRSIEALPNLPSEGFQPRDLLMGFLPFIPHPHVFPNFIMGAGPLLDMAEVAIGNRSANLDQYMYHKFSKDKAGWTHRTGHEPETAVRRSDLIPALVVSPKTAQPQNITNHPASTWIRHFLADLFSASGIVPSLVSPPTTETPDIRCFRSVWLPPQPLYSRKALKLTKQSLFTSNNRTKEARADFCSSPKLAVKILNQKGVGKITNVKELRLAINLSLRDRFADLDIEEVFLDDEGYETQVRIMQHTDVLLAAHSPGIANALFMRDKTFLLEILPFGYLDADFQKSIKNTFDIEGSFVFSEPDPANFAAILHDFCPDIAKNGTFSASCYREVGRLQHNFDTLSVTVNTTVVGNNVENLHNFEDACALMQHPGGKKALRAQALQPGLGFIRQKLRAWINKRCPK